MDFIAAGNGEWFPRLSGLRDCVRGKGHKYLAPLMYLAVRVGGVSWLPTPFRWGFGQKTTVKTTSLQ